MRAGKSEYLICETALKLEQRFALLDRVAVQRARLERSFLNSLHALKQQQKERRQTPTLPAQTVETVPPEQPAKDRFPCPPRRVFPRRPM